MEFNHVSAMWISPFDIFWRIWNITRKYARLHLSVWFPADRFVKRFVFFLLSEDLGDVQIIFAQESGNEISPL